ncbi:interferon-induced protein with tetratricopeptide repeats 5-like [Bombina bombina]|uniref:interferon-induced protein with tetratricopeptide repeats 5-like n=1 Tax=Bombina bombina TaxID=8345 RepID=UPI00235A77A2|nr:interferon-induced protein with tetratricopeptide repeats 5-like [Bombina bombina]
MWIAVSKSYINIGSRQMICELSKTTLNLQLLQLNCHFTWKLTEKVSEDDEIEERLSNQLEFLTTKNKYMVHNLLSYIKHLKGDYPEAISHLEKAEEMISESYTDNTNSKYLVTYANYAWVYYMMEDYEKSNIYLEKVKSIYKEHQLSLHDNIEFSEVYGEQGWSLLIISVKNYEKAKECFKKALETEPDDPEWNTGYATAVYRMEVIDCRQNPDTNHESLPLLKRAVELNPKDSVVKALLGLKLQELKQNKEARKYIEEALEQTPNLPYLLRYAAKFYRKEGLIDEALCVLEKAVKCIPNSSFLHHQIGLCYRQKTIQLKKTQRHYDVSNDEAINRLIKNAIFHFEMVLKHRKYFVHAYTDLANMYIEAKEYGKAEETFQKAFNIDNLTAEEKQSIHFSYGRFQEYGRKSEADAIKHYKEGLKIPENTIARQQCENALKRLANRMVKTDASNAYGFSLLGFIYKLNQNKLDAIECYEKALKSDPNNEEYLSELCDLKLNVG